MDKKIIWNLFKKVNLSVKILVYINILIFLVLAGADFVLGTNLKNIILFLGSLKGFNLGFEVYQLFTAPFLHADFVHLLVNMYALGFAIGPSVNKIFGEIRFLIVYFFSALTGSILSASFLRNPAGSIGASGAIMGLVGAILAFGLKTRKIELVTQVMTIALLNLFLGLTIPNIDNFGHLGGFIGGFIIAWFLITPRLRDPQVKKYTSQMIDPKASEMPANAYEN